MSVPVTIQGIWERQIYAAYATQPAADWLRKAPLHSLISCNHIEPHVRGQKIFCIPKNTLTEKKNSIQSDRTHRRFYLQNYLFIRAPDTHPLPKTLSNNPSDHCISLSAPFFDHSSMAPVECAHVKEACMNPHSSSDRTCTCPFWQPTHSEHKRSQRAR